MVLGRVGVFGSKQNVGYAVTVYNDGGGNKYYIDGVKQDTVTGLIRGAIIPLIHLIAPYHHTHLDSLRLVTEVMVVDQNIRMV